MSRKDELLEELKEIEEWEEFDKKLSKLIVNPPKPKEVK